MARQALKEVLMNVSHWRRLDDKGVTRGVYLLDKLEARDFNELGWGVFWDVNYFKGQDRRKSDLVHINAFFVEVDDEDKNGILSKASSFLEPSLVVESKRGFHLYWQTDPICELDEFDECQKRLVSKFNGDPNAKDVTRILRVPGFNHNKADEPFLIKLVHESSSYYSASTFLKNLKPIIKNNTNNVRQVEQKSNEFWDRVYALDSKEALERISGSRDINGDNISFKENTNGTLQIYVNDKSTSCWVDHTGHIGSSSKGGPTIFQWIKWYSGDGSKAWTILEKNFPELFETGLKHGQTD